MQSSFTPKESLIRGIAAVQGIRLLDICTKCKVHKTMFYRVIKGTRTSARIERIICQELGIRSLGIVKRRKQVGKAS